MLKKIVEEESKNSKSPRAQNRSKSANSSKSKSPTVIMNTKPILKKREKKDKIDLSNQIEVPPKFNVEQSSSFDVQLTGSTDPKKPMSNFLFYSIELSAKIREKNPDLKITEVSKLVGQSWG